MPQSRYPHTPKLRLSLLLVFALLLIQFGCASPPQTSATPAAKTTANKVYKIPANKRYRVKKGDTLFSIARRYGLKHRRLAAANRIRPPYTIFPGQTLTLSEKVSKKPKPTKKKQKKAKKKKPTTQPITNSGLRWQWPLTGKVKEKYAPANTGHKGIRIIGNAGQTVQAAAAGKVVYSGSGLVGYGELIIIKHNTNYLSAYAHTQQRLVKEGKVVKRGQAIARLGPASRRQNVLHFEIRRKGQPLDPLRLLPKRR